MSKCVAEIIGITIAEAILGAADCGGNYDGWGRVRGDCGCNGCGCSPLRGYLPNDISNNVILCKRERGCRTGASVVTVVFVAPKQLHAEEYLTDPEQADA